MPLSRLAKQIRKYKPTGYIVPVYQSEKDMVAGHLGRNRFFSVMMNCINISDWCRNKYNRNVTNKTYTIIF